MDEFEFKGKKENRLIAWFKKLSKGKKIAVIIAIILFLVVIAVGCAANYVKSKFEKLDTDVPFEEDEIIINETAQDIGVGYTNFVLFGADSRDNDVESDLNTDSIIIVSLNNETREIKLLSVYRDTLLDVGNGNIQKCNSAYRRGGAKQAINMLNQCLDMNIQKYVTVNWSVVSEVIDLLGGVEVDVTEAEMKAMNKFIKGTAKVAGKKAVLIEEPGVQTLDGVQATTYARIRKGVGDDYARTGRQRELIELALKKAIKSDLGTIDKIIDTVFPEISTNLTMSEILKYVSNLTKFQIVDNSGFPFKKDSATLSGRGSCAFSLDFVEDVKMLHEFLFGVTDFEPSDSVREVASDVAYIVRSTGGGSGYSNYNDDDNDWEDTTASTADAGTTADTSSENTTGSTDTTTEPPATTTEAPSTEPPATDAPSTEPPATDAPATDAPTNPAGEIEGQAEGESDTHNPFGDYWGFGDFGGFSKDN